jgi:hypothetical protein
VPTAFRWGLGDSTPLHQRREVDRLIIDVHPNPLQHVGGDVAQRFVALLVARHH